MQRDADLLAVQRRRGAAQQQIVGVGAGALVEPVDAGDDAVGLVGVFGDGETGEERVQRSVVGGCGGLRAGLGRNGLGGRAGASSARAGAATVSRKRQAKTIRPVMPASLERRCAPVKGRGLQPWRAL